MTHTPPRGMERAGDDAETRRRLRGLIDAGAVEVMLQPIVDITRGSIAGFEALSRPGKGSGFARADELFDAAARTGMLWDLERLTRRQVLAAATRLPQGVQLFLNSTPEVFADSRFAADLRESLAAHPGLRPGRIVLEITERSDQQYIDGLTEHVSQLKAAGFQIAIDDVGAGASGLNRIMALRPKWLKLDRDLVEDVHLDRVKQNLLRFLLHFARLSGVRLVAEGIEKEEELTTLIEMGVPYAQGYFLGRPAPTAQSFSVDLSQWICARRAATELIQFRDPRRLRLARLVQPAPQAAAEALISEVATGLLKEPQIRGVVVMREQDCVGWCDRDSILRAASTTRATEPVEELADPETPQVTSDLSLSEALEVASAREGRGADAPLIVCDDGRVSGIVRVTDLLQAAAAMARDVQSRQAILTGLPGREAADEQLTAAFLAAHARAEGASAVDIAVLDVRQFTEFNGLHGYELGDQLLRRLAAAAQLIVVRNEPSIFLAHLGDDRFLVIAPAGVLEKRLVRLIKHFDAAVGSQVGVTLASAAPRGQTPGATMRAVLIKRPTETLGGPADFHKLVDSARRDERRALTGTTQSILIVCDTNKSQAREAA